MVHAVHDSGRQVKGASGFAEPVDVSPQLWLAHREAELKRDGVEPSKPAAPAKEAGALAPRRAKQVLDTSERPVPGREEKQFVARNADTGEEVARFDNYEDASAHKEKFPNDDITHEPKEAALKAEEKPENNWFTDKGFQDFARDLDSRRRGPAMSHEEAKGHLAKMTETLGDRALRVDPSAREATVSPDLKKLVDAELAKGNRVKGVYDEETGIAHVFADSHTAGEREDLVSTAIHELTHKGTRVLLGKNYGPVMDDVYAAIKNSAFAKRLANARDMDITRIDTQRLIANEYVAHMAENVHAGKAIHADLPVPKDRNLFKRVWDAIRQHILQNYNSKLHWNDHDIATLIRQSNASMHDPSAMAREGAAYKATGGHFSLDNDDKAVEAYLPPDHPTAIGHKFGRTMEEQSKYNPGFVRDTKALLSDMAHGDPHAVLGAVGLRNIADFTTKKKMPSVSRFIDTHDDMEGRRRQLLEPDHKLAVDWNNYKAGQPDRGETLDDLIGSSTLLGHDPSKSYVERHTAEERASDPVKRTDERNERIKYNSLKDAYDSDAVGPKGRQIYQDLRDNYANKREKVMQALEARINATGADAQTKKNSIAQLRQAFESGKVRGPYFPLQRFGDLWANAKDEQGNTVAFSRFESRTQRDEWLKSMREQGLKLDRGENVESKSEMERIAPEFVRSVMAHAEAADPTGGLSKDIWQEYLKGMPEMSMRKHMITRLGRLGFSGDHLRAFMFNAQHGAHQLARLEYGHRLDDHMDNIKQEAKALGTNAAQNPDDANAQNSDKWGHAIAKEMGERYDWIRNPRASWQASALTKFGFGWYLGYAPATAFRIWSQNPMLAVPILAKQFGHLGAYKELGRATTQWVKGMGQRGFSDQLRGDELKAFQEAQSRGVFSETFTQNMANGGAGGSVEPSTAFKYAGWLFNAIEHHNRVTTHMAAYRLGRTSGMDHDTASKNARNLTWDSHFDYSNANRPRYLQNDFAKVAGLFKQYSLGVTYRLAREGADMVSKEKSPEAKAAAAQTLGSLIGHMMLFAGVTGIPALYWAAEKVMNGWGPIPGVKGGKDHPYDMTAALHKSLETRMGKTAADSIMTGPVGALSGASLSSGASYSDLWYKEPMRNENARDTWSDGVQQALGPIAAIPTNFAQGADQIAQGNVERGLEHFLPPEAAGLAKAVRYATQGAKDTRGNNMLPPGEEITNKDVALQALGFTPQKVADAQRRTAALKNLNQDIVDRHQFLQDKYEAALLAGDTKAAQQMWPQIQAFNEANPDYAIGKSIAKGVVGMAKRNYAATASQGAHLQPELQQRLTKEY